MPLERAVAIRLTAAITGLENHDEQIRRHPDHAIGLKKHPARLREYHAVLAVAVRLEMLVAETDPPVSFDVLDITGSAIRPPFLMSASDEQRLLKFIRQSLGRSPIAKLEITLERDLVLHAMVYDEQARHSVLRVVDSSASLQFRRAG